MSTSYTGPRPKYRAVPITLAEANCFVETIHRHNGALPSARLAVGAIDGSGTLRGVAIAGRAKARGSDHVTTLEVSRVCSDGAPNLCSFLYARIVRAARELGYARLITYTKAEEDGASLKASGWHMVAKGQRVRDWQAERRTGSTETPSPGLRDRWEIQLAEPIIWTWPEGLRPEAEPTLFDAWANDVSIAMPGDA